MENGAKSTAHYRDETTESKETDVLRNMQHFFFFSTSSSETTHPASHRRGGGSDPLLRCVHIYQANCLYE